MKSLLKGSSEEQQFAGWEAYYACEPCSPLVPHDSNFTLFLRIKSTQFSTSGALSFACHRFAAWLFKCERLNPFLDHMKLKVLVFSVLFMPVQYPFLSDPIDFLEEHEESTGCKVCDRPGVSPSFI